jgi:hypothetical protein
MALEHYLQVTFNTVHVKIIFINLEKVINVRKWTFFLWSLRVIAFSLLSFTSSFVLQCRLTSNFDSPSMLYFPEGQGRITYSAV